MLAAIWALITRRRESHPWIDFGRS